ncbi:hypothetical protein Tco_1571808, partial [Tanacetum coccineum]
MEILPVSTSNNTTVGDLRDPIWNKLVLTGYQFGPVYELTTQSYDESNTYVLERFNTIAGNPVKKILLKLNLSDHRKLKDGGE